MAYDAANGGQLVPCLDDSQTWTWDGAAWTQQASSPPDSYADMSMTYDPGIELNSCSSAGRTAILSWSGGPGPGTVATGV